MNAKLFDDDMQRAIRGMFTSVYIHARRFG